MELAHDRDFGDVVAQDLRLVAPGAKLGGDVAGFLGDAGKLAGERGGIATKSLAAAERQRLELLLDAPHPLDGFPLRIVKALRPSLCPGFEVDGYFRWRAHRVYPWSRDAIATS